MVGRLPPGMDVDEMKEIRSRDTGLCNSLALGCMHDSHHELAPNAVVSRRGSTDRAGWERKGQDSVPGEVDPAGTHLNNRHVLPPLLLLLLLFFFFLLLLLIFSHSTSSSSPPLPCSHLLSHPLRFNPIHISPFSSFACIAWMEHALPAIPLYSHPLQLHPIQSAYEYGRTFLFQTQLL